MGPHDSSPASDADRFKRKPSGIYFIRVRPWGKLFRQGLTNDVASAAEPRLEDFLKDTPKGAER